MKKIVFLIAIFTLIINAQDFITKNKNIKNSFSFTKENGIYKLSNQKSFDDNSKIIIFYNNISEKKNIEDKYELKNGKNKYNLYFIYEQNSSDLVNLFEKLSNEENIKSVYPNWTSSVKKF